LAPRSSNWLLWLWRCVVRRMRDSFSTVSSFLALFGAKRDLLAIARPLCCPIVSLLRSCAQLFFFRCRFSFTFFHEPRLPRSFGFLLESDGSEDPPLHILPFSSPQDREWIASFRGSLSPLACRPGLSSDASRLMLAFFSVSYP